MITMFEYIEGLLDEDAEEFYEEASTPKSIHLFEVTKSATKLDEILAVTFHHLVAKAVFLCKRARPGIQLALDLLISESSNLNPFP